MSAPSYSCSVNAWSASKIAQTVLRILELHSEAESDTSDSTSDADEPVTQTILDYACGRGLISQRLAPYARSIVGIDISHSAVEAYNAAARGNGLEQSEMHALQMDELRDEEGELGGRKFDLIVCGNAYHHVPDPHSLTRALSRRLKQGGRLIVFDLDSSVGFGAALVKSAAGKTVHSSVEHRGGFTPTQLQAMFDSDRFCSVVVEVSHSITLGEMRRRRGKPVGDDGALLIQSLVAVGIRGSEYIE